MNKKLSYREKQRRAQARRKRFLIIGAVVLVAVIAVGALILFNPRPQPVGTFTTLPTQTWPNASGKTLGPANAKVTVMEFGDFQCPVCKDFHDTVLPQFLKDYVDTGKVKFEFHHLIIIDLNVGGTESRRAAEASECANDQNRFWDYHNMLYANQQSEGSGTFSDSRLKAFAAAIGLDTARFNSCYDNHQDASKVTADEALAASNKLNATPSVLINGTLVQNPLNYDQLKAAVDAAIKQAGQ